MRNEFDLQNAQGFRIDPQVWLQTLLAIAGDNATKEEVIKTIAEQVDLPIEQVEMIFAKTIKVLLNDTRSN
jgi:hypothetical protein